jgi:hypothetical protein
MSTLQEIESAAKLLPQDEKEGLLLFIAADLRAERTAVLPPLRRFSKKEMDGWIAEDEADMRNIKPEK